MRIFFWSCFYHTSTVRLLFLPARHFRTTQDISLGPLLEFHTWIHQPQFGQGFCGLTLEYFMFFWPQSPIFFWTVYKTLSSIFCPKTMLSLSWPSSQIDEWAPWNQLSSVSVIALLHYVIPIHWGDLRNKST